MTADLQLLGVDYRLAPIEVREELSFSPAQAGELLAAWKRDWPGQGLAIVSTCNRTEFYLTGDATAAQQLLSALRTLRPRARALHEQCFRYARAGEEASLHLFRVAGGLESQIPGDVHILSQVRKAHELARAAGTRGALLDLTFHSASRAARRIRRETGYCRGGASVGGAVARTLAARFGPTRSNGAVRILVLGAGQAGVDIAAHLAKKRLGTLLFSSRRPEQAAGMAAEFAGEATPWATLDSIIPTVDAVVAATSGRLECLDAASLAGRVRPLVIVDAGVPRNVDPEARSLAGVLLLDLDMLEREQQSVIEARLSHRPAAETILAQETARWRREVERLAVEPAIKQLYESAESIRRALLREAGGHPDPDWITRRLVKRLLNGPVRGLRRRVRGGTAPGPIAWTLAGATSPGEAAAQ